MTDGAMRLGKVIFAVGVIIGAPLGFVCIFVGAIAGVCWTALSAGFEIMQSDYFAPIKKPNPSVRSVLNDY